ncbi:MAG: hypothetical protein K9K75_02805 [Deltaproteobacteria bacterium]|nr:hypothetical protein [Deltaproteobacteria bacterium]
MAKISKGDYLSCEICGLSLIVDETNAYGKAEVMCCDFPMASGKASAARARKRAKLLRAKIEESKSQRALSDGDKKVVKSKGTQNGGKNEAPSK